MPERTDPPAAGRVRLDKWLCAARFYKTRSLAAAAIESGHVRVDGERVKPARTTRPGERVTVRKQGLAWSVEVLAVSDRRGGAVDAERLYRETSESVAARQDELARRKVAATNVSPWAGRPTKRQRRKLAALFDEE